MLYWEGEVSMKVLKLIKNENGAATIVEASIVFPIVFFIVIVLFIMGIFQLELSTLQMKTDRIADTSSRIIAQKAYASYGAIDSGKLDFPSVVTLSEEQLKSIYADLDPYRYWGNAGSQLTSESSSKLKNMFDKEQYIDAWILNKTMKIKPQKEGLSNKVIVEVTLTTDFPDFISILGLPTEIKKTFHSTAYVSDTSEFIRNTDLVFDTAQTLADKFNISDKVSDIVNKIKKQFDFLGIGN